MLNVMRDNLRHLRWVLWAVAASMVLYLGAFFSCEDPRPAGSAADWAARIGKVSISATEFRNAARNIDEQYRRTFGDQYETLRPTMQIGSSVIQGLINSELVQQDARRMGLSVASEELAEMIRSDPNLQQDGQFVGYEIYAQYLQRNYPGGVTAYERDLEDSIIAQKWAALMTQSIHVTDAELEELHRSRTEKTAVDYVLVSSSDQDAGSDVSDAELRSWYDGHQDDYMRDPGRSIRFVSIERDRFFDQATVTEDEIAASYEVNKTQYSHPDQRRASHILLRVEPDATEEQVAEIRARAEGILARVQGGEAFEPLAQTLSEDPSSAARGGDLGFFERERMVPEFADAAFTTAAGQFAPVTQSQFGFHVIQVTDARAAGTSPLSDVREQIELSLKARRAQQVLATETERIAASIATGEALAGVAAAEGLEVQTRFVTRNASLIDLGVRPDFLEQVFAIEVGGVTAPLESRAGMLIVTVDEIAPGQVAPFDEVLEQVRGDVLDGRRHDLAVEAAQQAASGSWSLQSVARKLGLDVEESGDLAPGSAPSAAGGTNDELDLALFGEAAAVDDQGVVRVPNGALVYRISHRDPFDPISFDAARGDLLREVEQTRSATLRASLISKLTDKSNVEINTVLIAQIDGLR